MPFKSEKQRKFMWKEHPDVAQEWTDEAGSKPVNPDPSVHYKVRKKSLKKRRIKNGKKTNQKGSSKIQGQVQEVKSFFKKA